jgi:hypothetical protein
MRIESDGHSRGNPRLYELIEHAPKTGKSPTVWAWPELIDYLKIAGQPVPGPWPPHQEPRPDPEEDSLPVAVADTGPAQPGSAERTSPAAHSAAGPAPGPATPALGGSEAAGEEPAERHPESSLGPNPYGH